MSMQYLSTDLFSYSKKHRSFSAEASDLGWDRVPSTLWLRSSRTGRVVRFTADTTLRDTLGDNEVLGWVYGVEAHDDNNGLSPNLYDLAVYVYND